MLQTIIKKEITVTKQNNFLKTKLSFTSGGELFKIMSAKNGRDRQNRISFLNFAAIIFGCVTSFL